MIAIGERAPSFSLPDTEGIAHALDGRAIDLSAHSAFFSELPPDYLTPENIVNRKGL